MKTKNLIQEKTNTGLQNLDAMTSHILYNYPRCVAILLVLILKECYVLHVCELMGGKSEVGRPFNQV